MGVLRGVRNLSRILPVAGEVLHEAGFPGGPEGCIWWEERMSREFSLPDSYTYTYREPGVPSVPSDLGPLGLGVARLKNRILIQHEGDWEFEGPFSILFPLCVSPPSPQKMDTAALDRRVGRSQESGNLRQQKQGKSRGCLCRQHACWGPRLESPWWGPGCQVQNPQSPGVLGSENGLCVRGGAGAGLVTRVEEVTIKAGGPV